METSRRICNRFFPRNGQPEDISQLQQERYNINKINVVDVPSDVFGKGVMNPVNKRFASFVDNQIYMSIKKTFRYEDDISNKLTKMTNNTDVQRTD